MSTLKARSAFAVSQNLENPKSEDLVQIIVGPQKTLTGKLRKLSYRWEIVEKSGEIISVSRFNSLNMEYLGNGLYKTVPEFFYGTTQYHPDVQSLRSLYNIYNNFLGGN